MAEETLTLHVEEVWKLWEGQEVTQNLAWSSGRQHHYTFRRLGSKTQFCFNQDVKNTPSKMNPKALNERGKLGLKKAKNAMEMVRC